MTISRWVLAIFASNCLAWNAWSQPAAPAVPQRLAVPSLAAPGGAAIELDGWWYPATVEGPAPVVLMLHGCGGMLNGRGQPTVRMREYAGLLNAQGWHALALDSLSARGEKEICTQRIGTRRVTQTERRRDALGALQWLASQPGVDASRLALLGWSHGGSAVLAATNLNHADVARAPLRPKLAVAFYPGCEADLRRGYRPSAEALLLLGLADDWTPAAPCQALAQTGVPAVTVRAWEGAVHGFDGTAPVRHRADVPNGATPGQGVHAGGHAQARLESQQALLAALQRAFAR
jgi:dienelactone hydrolase